MKNTPNISYVERRDKQLWNLTLFLFGLLATFLVFLTLQYTSIFKKAIENNYYYSFAILTLLFIFYIVNNQRNIRKLKSTIDAEEKRIAALREESIRENLLSLGTKNHFEDCLAMEFKSSQISSMPFSILAVAVTNLSDIDKKFGFGSGNEMIVSVTKSLRDLLKETNLLFRYSNQMFTSILPETDKKKIAELTEQINTILRDITTTNGESLEIIINTASFPSDAESLHELRRTLFKPFSDESKD